MKQSLAIIIPVFDGWAQTRQCLEAVRNSDFHDYSVVVVDHGSRVETRSRLAVEFPEVTRLPGDSSLWWAGASNLGIRFALDRGARFIMLLNNDCYLATNTIGMLMRQAVRHDDALVAPVQRDYTTSTIVSLSPSTCLWLGFAGCRGPVKLSADMKRRQLLDVKLIGGGRGVIVPADVFEKVGVLDEHNLPHYYADHDFYLRCRAQSVPLRVMVKAEVFVDNGAGLRSAKLAELTWAQFLQSLRDQRSHRNLESLRALFRKHYPIRKLYWVGLALSLLRYSTLYAAQRSYYLVWSR